MGREYTIYKITSPSKKVYIGFTSMSISERWRKHKLLAETGKMHPFYCAIREYGVSAFTTERINTVYGKQNAWEAEKKAIAESPQDLLYNISSGGDADAKCGSLVFWRRMNENPEKKAEYIAKLSKVKKDNDWTDYTALAEGAAKWRKDNPREVNKIVRRANRVKRRSLAKVVKVERSLKDRLRSKYKLADIRRENTTAAWARLSDSERVELGNKISAGLKETYKDRAIIPNFVPSEWPFAKATCLRKIREGLDRKGIIACAISLVDARGSHWVDVQRNLLAMGLVAGGKR